MDRGIVAGVDEETEISMTSRKCAVSKKADRQKTQRCTGGLNSECTLSTVPVTHGRVALLDASQLVFYGCGPKARRAASAVGDNGTLRGTRLLCRAIESLRSCGRYDHVESVIDASTKHRLGCRARGILGDLVRRGDLQESPCGTTADEVLLRVAQSMRSRGLEPHLVSNDMFREYPLEMIEGGARVTFFVDGLDSFVVTS